MSNNQFTKITWIPTGDANKNNQQYDESGKPFKVSALSVPTPDIRWEIKYFSGSFQCCPYDAETGALRKDVTASIRLYAPQDIYDPRPNTPKKLLERKAIEVANIGGSSGSLSRGNAMLIICGAGMLHISWQFDEYKHPTIK